MVESPPTEVVDGPRMAASPNPALLVPLSAELLAWLDGGIVTANVGFDLAFEGRQLAAATREGRQLLSIRIGADDALIGPRWAPGTAGACAGCAEERLRRAVGHPLLARSDLNAGPRCGWPAALSVLVEVGLDHLGRHPLAVGEMLRVSLTETHRHRVARAMSCPLCGPPATHRSTPPSRSCVPRRRPDRLTLQSRHSGEAVPLRGGDNPALGHDALRRLVDHRVGPVLQLMRDNRAPFAMSGALVPGSRAMGYGRGGDFARAGTVAILEAYERLGASPHPGQVIQGLCFEQVREMAVDPSTLGRYTQAQLDHPNSRVMAYRPDEAMDWAYGHRLDNGEAWLVPADVAYYGYEYRPRLDQDATGRRPLDPKRVHFFAESSSGCALGSSLEEAALHALLELIERDSFLMAWCRRVPLPAITRRSVADPMSSMLLDSIEARGFDVHLLSTTFDLGLPSMWALAVNRTPGAVPATYSAAGSSPAPDQAVRAALWELAQVVARPVDWDVDAVRPMVEDPSLVDTIEDHVHLHAMPELRSRVTEVLGGPSTTLDDAFPGWPEQLCQVAGGDVLGTLEYLLGLCRAGGLPDVLVIDQSTREHVDLGLRVARVVVPGILPMCFGAPQQRLDGLPRRQKALRELGRSAGDADLLFDPHPFP